MIFGIEVTAELFAAWVALNVVASGVVVAAHTIRAKQLGLPLHAPSPSTRAWVSQPIGCALIALGLLAATMMFLSAGRSSVLLPLIPIGLWINLYLGQPKPPPSDDASAT